MVKSYVLCLLTPPPQRTESWGWGKRTEGLSRSGCVRSQGSEHAGRVDRGRSVPLTSAPSHGAPSGPSALSVPPHRVCLPDKSRFAPSSTEDASSPYASTLQTQVAPAAGGKAASNIPSFWNTNNRGFVSNQLLFPAIQAAWAWIVLAIALHHTFPTRSCWAQESTTEIQGLRIDTVRTCACASLS